MSKAGSAITILFILVAVVISAIGYFYYQRNPYSKDILELEIQGQREAEAMEEVEYTVRYKNNGTVALEDARLIFEYPEHSVLPEGESLRIEKILDDIYPGQEQTVQFKARLLGKDNEVKEAKALLSYRPKNISAPYDSSTSFVTTINFVPFTFEFDLPSRVETGREFRTYLNYFSNIDYPITGLRVEVEYPFGFGFIESDPKALGQKEWELGLLNKADGGRIVINGKVEGDFKEQKIFKAKLGIWQDGEFILLKETSRGVEISQPSLYISQFINNSAQYVASAGDMLHYRVFFKNASEKPFENLFLVARLGGEALDLGTLRSNLGEFQEGDNSIIWDWKSVPKLRFLGADEEGEVDFWVRLKDEWQSDTSDGKNPVVVNNVELFQAREEFTTKINSKLTVLQQAYFHDSSFSNSGPLPPQVGEKTYYTIFWRVKNFYNNVNNVKIKAVLPAGVELTGSIIPKDARFAFDSKTREIVWEIGNLKAGQGATGGAVELAFQVALTPTADQRGSLATLVNEARIRGEDQWTETVIISSAPSVDTSLPDDPEGGGGVVK